MRRSEAFWLQSDSLCSVSDGEPYREGSKVTVPSHFQRPASHRGGGDQPADQRRQQLPRADGALLPVVRGGRAAARHRAREAGARHQDDGARARHLPGAGGHRAGHRAAAHGVGKNEREYSKQPHHQPTFFKNSILSLRKI